MNAFLYGDFEEVNVKQLPGDVAQGENVTPRSCGYGDVTATYIRRSKIPSRIYIKHQYM